MLARGGSPWAKPPFGPGYRAVFQPRRLISRPPGGRKEPSPATSRRHCPPAKEGAPSHLLPWVSENKTLSCSMPPDAVALKDCGRFFDRPACCAIFFLSVKSVAQTRHRGPRPGDLQAKLSHFQWAARPFGQDLRDLAATHRLARVPNHFRDRPTKPAGLHTSAIPS
jgi:hypothetical protein